MLNKAEARNRRNTSLTVIKTTNEGTVHYNAAQLTAQRPGTEGRRSASPSRLLRCKVGQERAAIGVARQQAGAANGFGFGNLSAGPAEVQDLASLPRCAFDLTQPKFRTAEDLEISSEPQVLKGEPVLSQERRRRPSMYSPTAKLRGPGFA